MSDTNTSPKNSERLFSILIIDDDPEDRLIIRDLLERGSGNDLQYRLAIAEAGGYDEGRQILSAQKWNLVLVDHYLGSSERTGLRLIEEFASQGTNPPSMLLVTGKNVVDFSGVDLKLLGSHNVRLLAKNNLKWEVLRQAIAYVDETQGWIQEKNKVTSILVLEDDKDDFDMMRDYIKDHDFIPFYLPFFLVHVHEVDQALDLLTTDKWDVFIADYRLSGKYTGLDCIHMARERGIGVPTVIMSSFEIDQLDLNDEDRSLLQSGKLKYVHKQGISVYAMMETLGEHIVAFHA